MKRKGSGSGAREALACSGEGGLQRAMVRKEDKRGGMALVHSGESQRGRAPVVVRERLRCAMGREGFNARWRGGEGGFQCVVARRGRRAPTCDGRKKDGR